MKNQESVESFWVTASRDEISESSELVDGKGESRGCSSRFTTEKMEGTERAIEWNVALLKKYLERIVQYRGQTDNSAHATTHFDLTCGEGTILDEVKEVIKLPDFNARAVQNMRSKDNAHLSAIVEDQLSVFVAAIAHMYKENPFHSFQVRGET